MTYQIYSKDDIKNSGFKLVLIDNNFLSLLTDKINNKREIEEIRFLFKSNKIRPVLYEVIFLEFIQGIDKEDPIYAALIEKKRR